MPKFDGTGPIGQGPISGRGMGYCAINLPAQTANPYGFAGIRGIPVNMCYNSPPARRFGRGKFGRGRGRRCHSGIY
jgi:hypothetical protein